MKSDKMVNKKKEIERTKKLSVVEGSFSVLQTGFGTNHLTPYAIALGGSNPHLNTFIGLISSLPSVLGNAAQLTTHRLMKRYSRKNIISLFAFLQALMWIGIISAGTALLFLSISSTISLTILLVSYSLLIFFGAIAGPAWVSLMKDVVTTKRGAYFGRRNVITGTISLTTFVVAGLILNKISTPYMLYGFFVFFTIAFIGRSISAFLFSKHYSPKIELQDDLYFSFFQFGKKMLFNNFGRFTVFIALFSLAKAIASPFFSVYMLKNLEFSYLQWTAVVFSSSIATLIFSPRWGKFSDKYGNIRSMRITGAVIPILPLLWVFSIPILNAYGKTTLFITLCLVEFFSGALWSGFNLSSSNFIYDTVTSQRTAICYAYYGLINSIGVLIGATIGGFIASKEIFFFGYGAIVLTFVISGIVRGIVYLTMMTRLKEVRKVKEWDIKKSMKSIRNKKQTKKSGSKKTSLKRN